MKKIKKSKTHSKTVNACSKSDSHLLREYAKLCYDQLMREAMYGVPGQSSVLAGSKEHEPGIPVVLFNSAGDILSFVSVETQCDENGIPRSCVVETEKDIVAAAENVGWLSPLLSYGIPVAGGEDAFIEAHIEVSRKRGILDDMRRDIKGAI